VVLSAAALWLVASSLELLGLGDASLDSMQAFVAQTAAQTNQGGSAIDQSGPVTAIPMAFINILCRPFITEANSLMALVSSLEMMAFWALVLRNLPNLPSVLRAWQVNRLLRFVLPFVVLYILMLGLTFQNLGIIARQRALVMPALLVVVAASTAVRRTRTSAPAMRRVWRASDVSPLAVAGR
jgi:hypothetical protein